LVLDRSLGGTRDKSLGLPRDLQIEHRHFYDIVDYLKRGDILVFNNSKVFKARIFGVKETGGKREFLLVKPIDDFVWGVLVKGKLNVGDKVFFENKVFAEVIEKNGRTLKVRFNISAEKVFKYLEKKGTIPLPPYVKIKNKKLKIKNNFYQTVYAKNIGSVAAPTAGFHFTNELLDKLKKKGVECLNTTLHVGPGTFLPVEVDDVRKHKMHEEFFEIDTKTWNKIVGAHCHAPKRRVIAVGTTTCRVLEFLGQQDLINQIPTKNPIDLTSLANPTNPKTIIGSTNIFIYPPYDFKVVDALITNFHLPKSTLLMLVSAFADPGGTRGVEKIKRAYQKAIAKKYRFYSFGDSMLIL